MQGDNHDDGDTGKPQDQVAHHNNLRRSEPFEFRKAVPKRSAFPVPSADRGCPPRGGASDKQDRRGEKGEHDADFSRPVSSGLQFVEGLRDPLFSIGLRYAGTSCNELRNIRSIGGQTSPLPALLKSSLETSLRASAVCGDGVALLERNSKSVVAVTWSAAAAAVPAAAPRLRPMADTPLAANIAAISTERAHTSRPCASPETVLLRV